MSSVAPMSRISAEITEFRFINAAGWFALALLLVGCETKSTEQKPVRAEVSLSLPALPPSVSMAAPGFFVIPTFVEVSSQRGVNFQYANGAAGKRLMVEATGGGVGCFDFDRDGWSDLIFAQGGSPDKTQQISESFDQLFRNVNGLFANITDTCGIRESRYGQGVAVGDFDEDGFGDVLITNVDGDTLWHNHGDGTFEEIREWPGANSRLWSSSAAWADIDLDGDLDLYVCKYCDFDPLNPLICRDAQGKVQQCQPRQVSPIPDVCYRNRGDGTFEEIALSAGLSGPDNRALGVAIADFTNDGIPDIYVANDGTANFLFVREPDGQFMDWAPRLGCALDANGLGQGSMGVAVNDFDGNGWLDLYVTNFEDEWNTLYANFGDQGFADVTARFDAVNSTLPWVGFGVVMEDFDQNGHQDLVIANGHIDDAGKYRELRQPALMLTFTGSAWKDVSTQSGQYFRSKWVGRGMAQCDFDNDDDFDVVVVHQGDNVALLENTSSRGHWLSFEFVGKRSNRFGIGTRVKVTQGNRTYLAELPGGTSYCSTRQPKIIVGLGESTDPCHVEILWTSGAKQEIRNLNCDSRLTVIEETDVVVLQSRHSAD